MASSIKKPTLLMSALMVFITSGCLYAADGHKSQHDAYNPCDELDQIASFSNSEACEIYLKGYLAGASMIDEIYLDHLIDNHETAGFQNRAFRTRVGNTRSSQAEQRAPFCLPDEITTKEVFESLVTKIDQSSRSFKQLNEYMYQLLTSEYPC